MTETKTEVVNETRRRIRVLVEFAGHLQMEQIMKLIGLQDTSVVEAMVRSKELSMSKDGWITLN